MENHQAIFIGKPSISMTFPIHGVYIYTLYMVGGAITILKNHGLRQWDDDKNPMESHFQAMFQSPPTSITHTVANKEKNGQFTSRTFLEFRKLGL